MPSLANEALKQIFTEARTFTAWLPKEVTDANLQEIYNLMKWGPTSANTCPARIMYVRNGGAEKEKLLACLLPNNVDKVKSAPVTAILAQETKFYDWIPKLFPQAASYRDFFAGNPALAEATAFRNSSLQGGYFILAALALGFDCGPMSGFDNAKVDEAFFKGTSWKSNFICNIGYGDRSQLHPRNPRLSFEEACKILA